MRRIVSVLALLLAAVVQSFSAQGQEAAKADPPSSAVADTQAARKAREEDGLRDIEKRVSDSDETRRRLTSEVATLRQDRDRLATALVEAAGRAHVSEERIGEISGRLGVLADSEAAIRTSLEGRRDLIAEVLGALQRMGRRAGPATLLQGGDVLSAVRAAMMLGLVVPGLRDEAESLASDLAELVRLRDLDTSERRALAAELERLARERLRLGLLIGARQDQAASTEAKLGAEKARAEALGSEARSIRELLTKLEGEIGDARREAEEARRASEAATRQIRDRFAAAASRDPVRLAPKVPFTEAKGILTKPAIGATIREFGASDGLGGTMRGITIAARARAVVTAPADGWVVFAGPFRSFGKLLILNVGGGYHLLTAGLDQVSVETGQFVLAGEPIGQMGETASLSAALGAVETNSPLLYVEFRKDGASIDPAPWWSRSQSEKVRG